jgi:hypothetical protein
MERYDKVCVQPSIKMTVDITGKESVKISFIKIQNYAKDWFQMPCYRYTITNRKKQETKCHVMIFTIHR